MYSISSKVIFPSTFTPKKMDRWLYPFIMLTVSEVLMLWRLSTIWFETTVCDCNLYQSPTGHVYCSLRSASMHQATNSITRKPHNGEYPGEFLRFLCVNISQGFKHFSFCVSLSTHWFNSLVYDYHVFPMAPDETLIGGRCFSEMLIILCFCFRSLAPAVSFFQRRLLFSGDALEDLMLMSEGLQWRSLLS